MSMVSAVTLNDRPTRVLLIASLALNLFVIGTAGALLTRLYFTSPPPVATERPRTAAARIDRLAATLPGEDAAKLRAVFQAREPAVEATRDTLNRAYDRNRAILRAEPFDQAALRAAMAESREARARFDQALHDVIATAAAEMSPAGRAKLADWGQRPRTTESSR
jgi:uncharacterized membrane protein